VAFRSETWLSITPEPEGELPPAIATLRAGGAPAPAEVAAERRRAQRLITGARRRGYRRWLGEARRLASAADRSDRRLCDAARITEDVLDNHEALALGLEARGRGGRGGRGR
jgi:hypothetical protein